ncbi:hypothetical protein ACFVJH_32295 [Streptomyces decoyicus]
MTKPAPGLRSHRTVWSISSAVAEAVDGLVGFGAVEFSLGDHVT